MSGLFVQTWWLTIRRLRAFLRQPATIAFGLIQPVVWLFLFGSLFRRVADLPGFGTGSYIGFLVPGVVAMSAISSSMWVGMGTIDEIERGTLDRFLIAPVHRRAILTAAILEEGVKTAIQSALIVGLGWLAGARYQGGAAGVAVLLVTSVLLGTVFAALSNAVSLAVRQRESIIGLNLLLLLPLTFVSTAFLTAKLMPAWMRTAARFNPVNWTLEATRPALDGNTDWATVASFTGLLAALALVAVWLSGLTFRTYQHKL
jgi:ABC-2 type transport system permease protein